MHVCVLRWCFGATVWTLLTPWHTDTGAIQDERQPALVGRNGCHVVAQGFQPSDNGSGDASFSSCTNAATCQPDSGCPGGRPTPTHHTSNENTTHQANHGGRFDDGDFLGLRAAQWPDWHTHVYGELRKMYSHRYQVSHSTVADGFRWLR